jgi:hypothetical protein
MHATPPLRIIMLAVATLLAACSEPPTAPTELPADLRTVLDQMSLSGLNESTAAVLGVPVSFLSAPVPSSCTFDSSLQSFACPAGTVDGLTVTETITLFDASNHPQSRYDASSTAAVRVNATAAGTVTASTSSITVDERQEMTMSGLLTGTHTLNGTMHLTLSGTAGAGTTAETLSSTMTMTTTNLVLPADPHGFPASGTISLDATFAFGADAPFAENTQIVFNGTSTVAITSTVAGQSTHCTLDLVSHVLTCGV